MVLADRTIIGNNRASLAGRGGGAAVRPAAGRRSPARPIATEGQGWSQSRSYSHRTRHSHTTSTAPPRARPALPAHTNERKSDSPNLNRMRGQIKMKALFILRV